MPRKNVKMKPRISIAKSAGFCFGVRRAITLAENTAQEKKKIFTLGPLIHNPQEVRRLSRRGIVSLQSPESLKKATLILRTHGIPAGLREKLESRRLALVDATCPFVKRAQDFVQKLSQEGYYTVIVGDKTHPEVVALVSYGQGNCVVVERPSDVKNIRPQEKIGVVCQTTQTPENYRAVIRELKRICRHVKIFSTICKATVDRQADARRLARRVDVMIVVGGKNSGNTARLAEICGKYTATYPIETADELDPAWFRRARHIGLAAGASTPDWIIENVKNKIQCMVRPMAAM